MTCKAQRQGDEYFCPRCNWRWEATDDPPGECPEVFKAGMAAMLRIMAADTAAQRPPRLRSVPI